MEELQNNEPQDNKESKEQKEQETPAFRGLYKYVHISVKTLDRIIIGCIAVIVILLAIDLRNPGFTITFDSKGGTDVAPIQRMYDDLLEMTEEPTREGYEFTGWYKDPACDMLWQIEVERITEDITLYAGWEKIEP